MTTSLVRWDETCITYRHGILYNFALTPERELKEGDFFDRIEVMAVDVSYLSALLTGLTDL
jgi:hypothetical protein